MNKALKVFLVLLSGIFFSGSVRAEFATGTDDNGVFHFPQEMASWCSLNFSNDKAYTYGDVEKCFKQMCNDMNSPKATEAAKAKRRFEEVMKEIWINAFIISVEIKQKYANTKLEDEAFETNEEAGGQVRNQTTGNGYATEILHTMSHDLKRLRGAAFDLKAYRTMGNYCDIFGDDKKQDKGGVQK
ncbi:MAG: hypothetical protein IJ870_00985 [Alphaproteobacteria bacterium]|nr:hypothetical protein [Alphaproteobacteria bacterium]